MDIALYILTNLLPLILFGVFYLNTKDLCRFNLDVITGWKIFLHDFKQRMYRTHRVELNDFIGFVTNCFFILFRFLSVACISAFVFRCEKFTSESQTQL